MTPHTEHLATLLKSAGATEIKTGQQAGLSYVQFKDSIGHRQTRYGISDLDLANRIECYVKQKR